VTDSAICARLLSESHRSFVSKGNSVRAVELTRGQSWSPGRFLRGRSAHVPKTGAKNAEGHCYGGHVTCGLKPSGAIQRWQTTDQNRDQARERGPSQRRQSPPTSGGSSCMPTINGILGSGPALTCPDGYLTIQVTRPQQDNSPPPRSKQLTATFGVDETHKSRP